MKRLTLILAWILILAFLGVVGFIGAQEAKGGGHWPYPAARSGR